MKKKSDPLKVTGRQALKELGIPVSSLNSKSQIKRVLTQIEDKARIHRAETTATIKKHLDAHVRYVSVCAQATRALKRRMA